MDSGGSAGRAEKAGGDKGGNGWGGRRQGQTGGPLGSKDVGAEGKHGGGARKGEAKGAPAASYIRLAVWNCPCDAAPLARASILLLRRLPGGGRLGFRRRVRTVSQRTDVSRLLLRPVRDGKRREGEVWKCGM